MRRLTYYGPKISDLSPAGLTTTSSFVFLGISLRYTTNNENFGTGISQREVDTKMAGEFGLEGGLLRMAHWRNQTKIVPFHARISPTFLPDPQMTRYMLTTSMTLTHSPENWEFLGKPQRTNLLLVLLLTSALNGISKQALSHWERPRRISTGKRQKNGLPSWYIRSRKCRRSMANSSMHAWSFP